ncbi:MAG: phenylacetate--CoA ligase family protein [Desulfobacterales bacterium]|nr:phenylacetate--CoA ligase family protein [Desulfobacterales bacterium]
MNHLSPAERSQLQLENLQSTLNRAYRNVPFHQNRFQKLGMDSSQVESLSDLANLPFMERKHLGEHYPYGLFAVPLRDIVRIHTSPGTFLNPTVSGYTQHDLLLWREIVAKALISSGVTANDIIHIRLDPGLANWGRDYKDGAETIEASVIPNTFLSLEKQLMVLKDYKTSVLITTPSSAFRLAEHLFERELNPTRLNLKTLILLGEPVDVKIRDHLEKKLHVVAWLHYGLSEIPGPAIAYECKNHDGLHVNADHFLPEIIHPDTGKILPPGETGELVLTTLTTRAFPLIRFRTGDRACFIQTPCSCGCDLIRIKWFPERTDDIMNIQGVKVHQRQILFHIEQALGFVPKYHRFFENREGQRNCLEVWIAIDDDLFSDEIKMLEKLIRKTEDNLRENIGIPLSIRLKERRSLGE